MNHLSRNCSSVKKSFIFRTGLRRKVFAFVVTCIAIELLLRYDVQEGLHVWGLPWRICHFLRLEEPCYRPEQPQIMETLRQLTNDFVDIAESEKMVYWLDYGSLLGAVRDGKIIPWDWDVDFGVMKSELESERVQNRMRDKGFRNIYMGACKYYIYYKSSNLTHLDVYMHLIREDDMAVRCEIEDNFRYQFPVKWITPTAPIEFEGRMIQAPRPPMAMITEVRYPYSYWLEMPQNFYCLFTKWKYFKILIAFCLIVILPVSMVVYCCCRLLSE